MSYTLITANRNYSSWSLRPWVLMKALGIPFADRIEPFQHSMNHAAFRVFSPTGQVPVLIDGERTAWDSLGITLYLADRHPGIWPEDDGARAFAQCAVAEMHSGFATLRNECPMNIGVRVETDMPSPQLNRDIARLSELWGEGLKRFGGPYLAGTTFTAIDAFYAPVAFRVRTYDLDVGPVARNWVELMLAHPSMREWEAAALAETWREESHEAEVGAAGRIIQDHRAS
jgi:glutathione S-transferase